jgi:hypothetical protein
MNWVDLTDLIFCNTDRYAFAIQKPEYGTLCQWSVRDRLTKEVIESGQCSGVMKAKAALTEIYRKTKPKPKGRGRRPKQKSTLFIMDGKIYG